MKTRSCTTGYITGFLPPSPKAKPQVGEIKSYKGWRSWKARRARA